MFRAEERILALALVAILTSVALPDLTDLPLRVDHSTSENQNDNRGASLSSFRTLPGNVQKDEVLNTTFDVSPTLSSFRMLPGSAQTLSFQLV